MTPDELLAPQPPTKPGDDQRAVWGLIYTDLEMGRYALPREDTIRDFLQDLFDARDAQGAKKYGHRLPVDSGRDSRVDELQEALDGLAYSRQTYEQACLQRVRAGIGEDYLRWDRLERRAWERHLRCLQTVLELLEELHAI